MRNILKLVFTVTFLCFSAQITYSAPISEPIQKKVALVIGNQKYSNIDKLENVGRDIDLVSKRLAEWGFQVYKFSDLNKNEFERVVQYYSYETIGADVSLVYYAGHAVQVNGDNYAIPIDADFSKNTPSPKQLVHYELMQSRASFGAKMKIIVMDSCRDNPFNQNFSKSNVQKAKRLGFGLSPRQKGPATMIMSTQPHTVAFDGPKNSYSPFAKTFADLLNQEQLNLKRFLLELEKGVLKQTNGEQRPWYQLSKNVSEDILWQKSQERFPIKKKIGIKDKTVKSVKRISLNLNGKLLQTKDHVARQNISLSIYRDIVKAAEIGSNLYLCYGSRSEASKSTFSALNRNIVKFYQKDDIPTKLAVDHFYVITFQFLTTDLSKGVDKNGVKVFRMKPKPTGHCTENQKKKVNQVYKQYIEASALN